MFIYSKNIIHNKAKRFCYIKSLFYILHTRNLYLCVSIYSKTEQDVINILGIMYGAALFLGFTNTMMVQPIIDMERTVFYRERSTGMYSSIPYAISQVILISKMFFI